MCHFDFTKLRKELCQIVKRIPAVPRSGGVAGSAGNGDLDRTAAAAADGDIVLGGFADNGIIGQHSLFPCLHHGAESCRFFCHHACGDHIPLRQQSFFFQNVRNIQLDGNGALGVGSASSPDPAFRHLTAEGRVLPRRGIPLIHGVHVTVECDARAASTAPHPAEDASVVVRDDLVVRQLPHFPRNILRHLLFLKGHGRNPNQLLRRTHDLIQITGCDFFVICSHDSSFVI